MTRLAVPVSLALVSVLWLACGGGGDGGPGGACAVDDDCPAGRCLDGRCAEAPDTGPPGDGGADTAPPDAGVPDAPVCEGTLCGRLCCSVEQVCRFGDCVSDLGPCESNDDCWGDSYCADGRCIPYGVPADRTFDSSCTRFIDIEALVPSVQCRWTGPPEGDPFPGHVQVMSTPVVVDLDLDEDPRTLAPSIVFATFPSPSPFYRAPGRLRIVDGGDCTQQFTLPDEVMSPASVAAGDLDGDGRPELVAVRHEGGLIAFGFDTATDTMVRLWRSGTCDGAGGRVEDTTGGPDEWSGPSIHDLDDDGRPELLLGATVYDADGCIVSSSLGYPTYSQGLVPVVADADEDGLPELVMGNGIYAWDSAANDFVPEGYFAGAGLSLGQVAIADFGVFPLASMAGGDRAEVAVISSGTARVQTLEGTIVFGPVAVPGGGTAGAPTVADFDGDGRAEFATAGGSAYVVFDLDCVEGGDPAGCASGSTSGVLWTQPSQDNSSNVTGSSVFDFDADGAAEAVYADECFLRIYDGATGTVRYSAARSSGTTYENPVIADVDGDYHSEIVSAVNDYAGNLGCPASDPLLPGAAFAVNRGIVVLRDELDRWAASRPVWNQHAYAVTHVTPGGQVPRSSEVPINWRTEGLNNFRQNVQGELDALGLADLTAASETGPLRVLCTADVATLVANVCNRGSLPLAAGTEIAFLLGTMEGEELCRALVPVALTVGECTEVTCDAPIPGGGPVDLFVEVDPDSLEEECFEGNNFAVLRDVECQSIE